MERQMKRILAIAAVMAGMGTISPLANAQGYIVNGRAASATEAQLLVAHGAQPGSWTVDGYGTASTSGGQSTQSDAGSGDRKCWYVLDVQLCE
jgi:hypothetical protein